MSMINVVKLISAALLFLILPLFSAADSLVATSAVVATANNFSDHALAAASSYLTADFSVGERFVLPSRLLASEKTIIAHQNEKIFLSDTIKADFPFSGLILRWRDFSPPGAEALLEVALLQSGTWTEWREVEPDNELSLPAADDEGYFKRDSLVFAQNAKAFRYRITLRTTDPALTPVITDLDFQYLRSQGPVLSSRLTAGLILPFSDLQIVKRSEWGANEEFTFKKYFADTAPPAEIEGTAPARPLPPSEAVVIKKLSHDPLTGEEFLWPLEYPDRVKKIFIHHTATTKDLQDPVTALRNIYYYHAVGKRWGDIGYNYLIDPQGKIYEGRRGGDAVVGGHTNGYNRGSVGIALLGDFEKQQPTYAMLTSLIKLTRQISDTYGLDPEGVGIFNETVLPNISGHHEVSATRCPGGSMTDMLPAVRRISAKIAARDNAAFSSSPVSAVSSSVPNYAFTLVESLSPVYLEADSETELTIRLKNTGLQTWDKRTFLIAAENPDNQGRVAFPDQHEFSLQTENTVAPGEIGSYKIKLKSARQSALLAFDLTLIFNGAIKTDRYFPLPVYVNSPPVEVNPVYVETEPAASLMAAPAFLTLKPRETKTLQFQLRNTGGGDWSQADQDKGLFQVRTLHNPSLGLLSQPIRFTEALVKNGEIASFNFSITAPAVSENYSVALIPIFRGQKLLPRPIYFYFGVSNPSVVKIDPGLNLSQKTEKPLRVRLSFNDNRALISSGNDYVVRSKNTDLLRLSGGDIIELTLKNNKITVKNKNSTFALPAPLTFVPATEGILTVHNLEKRPAWNTNLNDNRFRGILEIGIDDNRLLLINELPLEQYLAGIGEVSNGDPEEKIKAIIILARTYARYYRDRDRKFPGSPYDLDDNPDVSQKYLGYGLEERSPRITQAVRETRGQVVTYLGELVKTPYFNSSDGRTRSAKEVWGWKHTPYLESVPDPLCAEKVLKGHGVGLSGCGATAAAKLGKSALEIIQYYYRGVEIEVRQ